jgi:peptidoglycan/xylan/chitin deacetylase (PgdA/CDA1 family)
MTPTRPGPVPILMYHEIARPAESASRLAVSPDAFAAQLAYLHDEGFTTVTVAGLRAALAGGAAPLPDRAVVLTFDDGYEDFHRRAMPLLERYGFTATVFVTTGWIQDAGARSAPRRPGRMLSWSQIAEAACAGIEVGAHSHAHPQLDQLPGRLLREELHSSKAQLEDKLGARVAGLAYPFGYYSAKVRETARVLDHDYACAVRNVIMNPGSDPLALPRLTIRKSTPMTAFQQIAGGRNLPAIFRTDRALTRGWAAVRHTRATVGTVLHGQ